MSNQSITLATFYLHARGLKMLQYEYVQGHAIPFYYLLLVLLHGTFRLVFVWHRLVLYRLVIPSVRANPTEDALLLVAVLLPLLWKLSRGPLWEIPHSRPPCLSSTVFYINPETRHLLLHRDNPSI